MTFGNHPGNFLEMTKIAKLLFFIDSMINFPQHFKISEIGMCLTIQRCPTIITVSIIFLSSTQIMHLKIGGILHSTKYEFLVMIILTDKIRE